MKTIKEWLSTLPEPYRSQALGNTDKDDLVKCEISLIEALQSAFVWNDTKEGFTYWGRLMKLLASEITIPPTPASAPSQQLFTREDMRKAYWKGRDDTLTWQQTDNAPAFDDFMQTNYPKQ